ncbi:MAG: hypothetical protein K1Y36_01800 [Blastocatellia bacterium]|nr:hypothetical protein [Blastocatellia bacterium]
MPTWFTRIPASAWVAGLAVVLVVFLIWITSSVSAPPDSSGAIPKNGYVLQNLRVAPATPFHEAAWSIENNPSIRSGLLRTGNDCFYIDDTGVIRHSGNPAKSATTSDPTLE